MALPLKPFLKSVALRDDVPLDRNVFPFSLPLIKCLDHLEFHPDVTFFVGENGSGESTLLEAIAIKAGFGAEGGTKNVQIASADTISELHDNLRISRGISRPTDGYFLRAETFYNVATYMEGLGMEEVRYLDGYGGKSPHACSHGEAFLTLLTKKFRGDGLYLLDEPEAALSPNRQLSALCAIDQLVKENSQFIIATHSPILLAYPNAKILGFSERGIEEIRYEETEHFQVTKRFLNEYPRYLRYLLKDDLLEP